jgi:Na+-driven multidrug efflux pump
MSASTALAENRLSFLRLRNFIYALNGCVTLVQLLILIPAVFHFVMIDLVAVPPEVADLTYWALWLLLPWPGAIGYRRLFQGVLIRDGMTRLVALGTVVRLSAMASTGLILFFVFRPPGAWVGAASLSMGVLAEAVASRLMARGSVRKLLALHEDPPEDGRPWEELTYRRILRFYYPLALTSMIGLAAQPMLTFFMGRAGAPVESLAVFPVVASLTFIFRSVGLSFQEVGIALMGRHHEHIRPLGRFGLILALCASGAFALVAFTPFAEFWFVEVSGLSPELAHYALIPTAVLVPMPFLAVLLSFQRGILVVARKTRPITIATAIEVTGIALLFPLLGYKLGLVGVTAAAIAIVLGRIAANSFLIAPCRKAIGPTPWQSPPDSR